MYKKYYSITNSGTSALIQALKVCRSKNVIIPTYTCTDILDAVLQSNCNPIIVDCNKHLQIDFNEAKRYSQIADTIIIPHMFGIRTPVEIYKKLNIKIIEDLSQCHGLKKLGRYSDVTITSFNKSKWIDCNGGGMIWYDKKINNNYYKFNKNNLPFNLENKFMSISKNLKIRREKADEIINSGISLIGSNIPNSWLRGMYFTNKPKRKPYIPLHEQYGNFKCPVVDSYSNKIDWISIFV